MKNRYFIVTCMFLSNLQQRYCTVGMVTENGKYVRKKDIKEDLKTFYVLDDNNVIITNIIELSKKDYECFINDN